MSISIPVITLPLKNETIKRILSFGVTTKAELDIVYKSTAFLSLLTSEQKLELDAFYQSSVPTNKVYTGYDMYYSIGNNWRDIVTTSSSINTLLHGGLKQGTITEISGRGGTGKTQFCLMFCATVQIPNTLECQYQAIYIDTENTFNALRLNEMLKKQNNPRASLDNIFVWKPTNLTEFLTLLHSLPIFLSQHPSIRLIAIDSIAYFYRQFTDMIERSTRIHEAIQSLLRLVKEFSISVVVTNHVTSFNPDVLDAVAHSKQTIQPLLGPMWWHSVTNQILLSMSQDGQRSCTIKKSSYLAEGSADFQSKSFLSQTSYSCVKWNSIYCLFRENIA